MAGAAANVPRSIFRSRRDPAFRIYLEEYAQSEERLKEDFGAAFKKLTELGCGV